MKALTLRQPWAYAVMHLGKTIENRCWAPRTRSGSQRVPSLPGRIAIHAGKGMDDGWAFQFIARIVGETKAFPVSMASGAIIGTVDIVSVHHRLQGRHQCTGTHCEPWGLADADWHWVLADPQPCGPIPCRGALGLWTVPDNIAAQLEGLPR